jgi:uncharacterized protein (DUF1501 family)
MMKTRKCSGCDEYDLLTRRSFVGLSAGLVASAVTPSWLPRVVYAEGENSSRDVLVSLFLRGGGDALTLCVPFTEARYYSMRPGLAIPPPDSTEPGRAIDLDGTFGLPPTMAPLLDAYQDGNLLIVHACGLQHSTRSHFEAMHFMEVGMDSPPAELYTGWLGRHLQVTAPTLQDGVLRAVGIGTGLPRTLVGGPQTIPVRDLADFDLEGPETSRAARRNALQVMYTKIADPLKTTAESTFKTIDLLKTIDFAGYLPAGGAVYPEDELGYALESTAALIKAEVGAEAIAIDLGGWDTHDSQGPVDGHMAALMGSLAAGLGAFHKDLFADDFTNVVLVAMSEFGRNAFENASGGTDHGHGGVMLALGGGIAGGRVLAEWPGLEPEQLYEGQDLEITIDYRDILTEIITRRLGNPDFRSVFNDSEYEPTTWGVTV